MKIMPLVLGRFDVGLLGCKADVSEEHTPIQFFGLKDGDSMFLRNVGIYMQAHAELQPRRLTSTAADKMCINVALFVVSE
jgi:hypothetical protein